MNPLPQPQQFLSDLQRLASLLFDHEDDGTSPTLRTLLYEICRAAAMIRGGCSSGACEDFAISALHEAMGLLQNIIQQGIELLQHIDWRDANSRLVLMIAAQTGFDLGL